jgi:hypothetical protein
MSQPYPKKKIIRNTSQQGQGVVEYILLLVVVLSLGYALLNRLFTPVQNWTSFYIGQYIDCLLDQGELPSLLGSNDVQDCNYEAMIAPGNQGPDNRSPRGSGPGSGNSSNPSESRRSEGESNRDSNRSSDSSSSSSRNPRNSQADGSRGSKRLNLTPWGSDYRSLGNRSGKELSINLGEDSSSSLNSESSFNANTALSNQSQMQRRRHRIRRVRGLTGALYEQSFSRKGEKKPLTIARNKLNDSIEIGGGLEKRSKKLSINTEKRSKIRDVNLDMQDFSFGYLFRIALIIIIILAIIWIIGSQVAQVSKNLE